MNNLDSKHYHEALDRVHVVRDIFYEHVESHPVVKANPELLLKAIEASTLLYKFYLLVGEYGEKEDRAVYYD